LKRRSYQFKKDAFKKLRVLTYQSEDINPPLHIQHSQSLSKSREKFIAEENVVTVIDRDEPDCWELEVRRTEEEQIKLTCRKKDEE
jgi:hypothetical protein